MKRLITITLAILLLLCMVTALFSYPSVVAAAQGSKMYWTDSATDKIQRANLDGSNVDDLVTGLGNPRGIALDIAGGKMYWTDSGTNKIQRADLNGSNVEDLVTGLSAGIALDVAGGKMYWADWGTDKIQRADLNGSNVEDLVTTGLSVKFGIALLHQAVGGDAYPVNKIAVLWPWLTLATAIIIGGIILLRRRAHS
ncbi:hypothetical protein ACFLVS_05310 [Chloroflexota bacterium]